MDATLGIDLSSQPKSTAICLLAWSVGRADVLALWRGTDPAGRPLSDSVLIELMTGSAANLPAPVKVAIDAPLGVAG